MTRIWTWLPLPFAAFERGWSFKLPSREGGRGSRARLHLAHGSRWYVMLRGTYLIHHPSFPLADPTSVSNLVWVLRDIHLKRSRELHMSETKQPRYEQGYTDPHTVGDRTRAALQHLDKPIASCGLRCQPTGRLDRISAEFQSWFAKPTLAINSVIKTYTSYSVACTNLKCVSRDGYGKVINS